MARAPFIFFLFLSLLVQGQSRSIPAFKFTRLDGVSIFSEKNMASGKKALFIFYDITCPHCQQAIKAFNKNANSLKNISVYLITLENPRAALKFLSQYANPLYEMKNVFVLLDRYNEFITKFQPVKYPSIFLYSEKRKLELYSDEPKDVPKFLRLIKKQ
jgi:thiol-disulfide isomerase/thioredoxin